MLNSLAKKLFSIKKRYISNENYRVVTILGITFKFPLKNRIKPVWAKDVCCDAVLAYPEEKFVFTEKRDVFNTPDPFFKEYSLVIPENYIYFFENMYCFTDEPAVFPDEKTVVEELTMFDKNLYVGKRYLDFSDAEYYDGTVALLSLNGLESNYSHWCMDCLPRLYLLLKNNINPDYYIIDNHVSFQKEYLELLGIPQEKIINPLPKRIIRAKRIVTPTVWRSNSKLFFSRGYQFPTRLYLPGWTANIYKEYLADIKGNNTERIFISRKNAKFRTIENEEEISEICKRYGFTVLALEKLSVLDQIRYFRDAKIVVGIHGAGTVNIVHCSKDVKVLELNPEYFKSTGHKMLAQVLGCRHYFFSGKTKDITMHPQLENVYFDPKIFEKVLVNIISEKV